MELTIQLGDSSADGSFTPRVVKRTDTGNRAENQDALDFRQFGDWLVCVLADGAGGHQAGEVAAAQATQIFLALFSQAPTLDSRVLLSMVHQVNQEILNAQKTTSALEDMHTTLCALVLNCKTARASWLHAGDSRVYHFNHDQLSARTKDHSVLQWMQDNHPQDESAQSRNALYSALGEQPEQLQLEVSPACKVSPGDWFLLCSDGLWEHFTDEELGLLGCNLRHDTRCAEHIHQLALARAQGRADNLSSILVFLD